MSDSTHTHQQSFDLSGEGNTPNGRYIHLYENCKACEGAQTCLIVNNSGKAIGQARCPACAGKGRILTPAGREVYAIIKDILADTRRDGA